MSLWGNKDGVALTETVNTETAAGDTTLVVDSDLSSTVYPGDTIIIDEDGTVGAEQHKVLEVSPDGLTLTLATAIAAVHAVGTDLSIKQAPKYSSATDINSGLIIGADTDETTAASAVQHAGWLKKHTKTRDGVTSTWYETLVASSSITGDDANDGLS